MDKVSQIFNYLEMKLMDNRIHEFQLGVIYTYRDLPTLVKRNQISIFKTGNMAIKDAFYLFSKIPVSDIQKILSKQTILSPLYVAALNPEKRCEVTYLLSEVFAKENYKSPKKYYKHVTRGINFFNRGGYQIRILKSSEAEEAIKLYRKWVKYKYENYTIFRIMFPEKRYERCLIASYKPETQGKIITLGAFDDNNNLVGFRTVYRKGNQAYDLAYITDRDLKITDFSEFFEIETLRQLKENYGIEFFNCGLSQGDLKRFKAHLPHKETIYYKYSKISKQ